MKLFAFLKEVLEDPNDKQGSTKRVCLLMVVFVVLALLVAVTVITRALPAPPQPLLDLVYFLVATFTGGMVIEKGMAAAKAVFGKETGNETKPAETP